MCAFFVCVFLYCFSSICLSISLSFIYLFIIIIIIIIFINNYFIRATFVISFNINCTTGFFEEFCTC